MCIYGWYESFFDYKKIRKMFGVRPVARRGWFGDKTDFHVPLRSFVFHLSFHCSLEGHIPLFYPYPSLILSFPTWPLLCCLPIENIPELFKFRHSISLLQMMSIKKKFHTPIPKLDVICGSLKSKNYLITSSMPNGRQQFLFFEIETSKM